MIVLDTSILSVAFRRRGPASPTAAEVEVLRRLILEDERLAVPGIVLQELLSGTRAEAQFARLEHILSGFPLLAATRADHVAAAGVATACRRHGVTASTVDCLIAAQTITAGAALFTLDEDFVHIAPHVGLGLFDPSSYRPHP